MLAVYGFSCVIWSVIRPTRISKLLINCVVAGCAVSICICQSTVTANVHILKDLIYRRPGSSYLVDVVVFAELLLLISYIF